MLEAWQSFQFSAPHSLKPSTAVMLCVREDAHLFLCQVSSRDSDDPKGPEQGHRLAWTLRHPNTWGLSGFRYHPASHRLVVLASWADWISQRS